LPRGPPYRHRFVVSKSRPVEYFLLIEPRDDGPVIGYFGGRLIPACVIGHAGRRYSYAGTAPRRRSGSYDVDGCSRANGSSSPA
jgi:hypothetical protein